MNTKKVSIVGDTVRNRIYLNNRDKEIPKTRPTEIEITPRSKNWHNIYKGLYQ